MLLAIEREINRIDRQYPGRPEAALQKEQMATFEAADSAGEIVAALKAGLHADLQFWSGAAKYTHAGDLPVVEEFVNAKRELLLALESCPVDGPSNQ